jgi:hypothetical protein
LTDRLPAAAGTHPAKSIVPARLLQLHWFRINAYEKFTCNVHSFPSEEDSELILVEATAHIEKKANMRRAAESDKGLAFVGVRDQPQ